MPRHITATWLAKACEKYNAAALLGWTVLRVDAKIGRLAETVEQFLMEVVA